MSEVEEIQVGRKMTYQELESQRDVLHKRLRDCEKNIEINSELLGAANNTCIFLRKELEEALRNEQSSAQAYAKVQKELEESKQWNNILTHTTKGDAEEIIELERSILASQALVEAQREALKDIVEAQREALKDIERCLGFCPDHLGAENYKDPGIVLAKEIIEHLRDHAGKALALYPTGNKEEIYPTGNITPESVKQREEAVGKLVEGLEKVDSAITEYGNYMDYTQIKMTVRDALEAFRKARG